MTAQPTIQQIQESIPQGLWDFLTQLPASFEAQELYALILAGAVGMLVNFSQKWGRGEITGNLIRYLFIDGRRGTWLSFSGAIGLGITAISAGVFMVDGGFVGWKAVLWVGVLNGYTSDSISKRQRCKYQSPIV